MNKLEMYKALSDEDKDNLLMYSIYNGIYDVARNHNSNISDKEVEILADLSYDNDTYFDELKPEVSFAGNKSGFDIAKAIKDWKKENKV